MASSLDDFLEDACVRLCYVGDHAKALKTRAMKFFDKHALFTVAAVVQSVTEGMLDKDNLRVLWPSVKQLQNGGVGGEAQEKEEEPVKEEKSKKRARKEEVEELATPPPSSKSSPRHRNQVHNEVKEEVKTPGSQKKKHKKLLPKSLPELVGRSNEGLPIMYKCVWKKESEKKGAEDVAVADLVLTYGERAVQAVVAYDVEHDVQFVIDSVKDMKGKGDSAKYKVRWQGYPPAFDTWEEESALGKNGHQLIAEYLSVKK